MDELESFYAKVEEFNETDDITDRDDFMKDLSKRLSDLNDYSELQDDLDVQFQEERKYDAAFWQSINNSGFLIFSNKDGSLTLQKFSTPLDDRNIPASTYSTMDEIADTIKGLMQNESKKFLALAAYNKGFGPEFSECTVQAKDENEAKIISLDIFKNEMHLNDLSIEITVRPAV